MSRTPYQSPADQVDLSDTSPPTQWRFRITVLLAGVGVVGLGLTIPYAAGLTTFGRPLNNVSIIASALCLISAWMWFQDRRRLSAATLLLAMTTPWLYVFVWAAI